MLAGLCVSVPVGFCLCLCADLIGLLGWQVQRHVIVVPMVFFAMPLCQLVIVYGYSYGIFLKHLGGH